MKILVISILSLSSLTAHAEFREVWQKIKTNSFQQKSANAELEAQQIQQSRSAKHWMPKVYAGGSSFRTNDPGASFFSTLSQRSLEAGDFQPRLLNRPEMRTYHRATLGADLPLFEGGMKVAINSAQEKMTEAKKFEKQNAENSEYAELAVVYGKLIILTEQKEKLEEVSTSLDKLIKNYQVGAKSNPVGYSGLLGLKNVKNRADGFLSVINAEMTSILGMIKVKANDQNIKIIEKDLKQFIQENLQNQKKKDLSSFSKSLRSYAEGTYKFKNAERARFLPQVGLFGESNEYYGNRDNANSVTMGIYLKWELFNGQNLGATDQAEASAVAMDAKARFVSQSEEIAQSSLNQALEALDKNLEILSESEKLLSEQMISARTLFLNGMLSGLQLAEVLNRRTDLIEKSIEVKTEFLNTNSKLYTINN